MRPSHLSMTIIASVACAHGATLGARQPQPGQPLVVPSRSRGEPGASGQPVRVSLGATPTSPAPSEPTNPAPAGWWDERPPQIGDDAPPLSFETIYDRPDSIPDPASFSWSQYAGKVVVIDFSTSWCGPCRMMVPHMNQLVDALAGEPIVFITVSNETEAQIARFRSDLEFKSLFARDVDGSTFQDYWVNGIPHVAIIDTVGKLAALTHPSAIEAGQLKALARGERVEFWRMNESPTRVNWNASRLADASMAPPGLEDAASYAVMRRVDTRSPSVRSHPITGDFATEGSPALTLLLFATDLPSRSVDVRASLSDQEFYAAFIRPGDGSAATARAMLLRMVEATLGLEVRFTNDPGPVRLLGVNDPARLPPVSEPGTPSAGSMSPGRIDMRGLTLAALARHLSGFTSVPVVDDSGLDTKFNIRLEYDPRDRESFIAALASIGLELTEGERPVRRAIVETARD